MAPTTTTEVLTVEGVMVKAPGIDFYTAMPGDAPALFSRRYADITRPRKLVIPAPYHTRSAWSDQRVELVAKEFRRMLPGVCATIDKVKRWEDLYMYFDAYDLWWEGAWNLFAVMDCICQENDNYHRVEAANQVGQAAQAQTMSRLPGQAILDSNPHWDPETFAIVDDWMTEWLASPVNRHKLRAWNTSVARHPDIMSVFSYADRQDIGDVSGFASDMLRELLRQHRDNFLGKLTQEAIVGGIDPSTSGMFSIFHRILHQQKRIANVCGHSAYSPPVSRSPVRGCQFWGLG